MTNGLSHWSNCLSFCGHFNLRIIIRLQTCSTVICESALIVFAKEQNRTARMMNRSILKTINVWFSFATVILCCIKTGYQVLKQVIYFSQTYSQGAHRIFAMLANIELEQIAQGCAIKIQHMAPFGENKCNSSSPRTDLIHLEIWL